MAGKIGEQKPGLAGSFNPGDSEAVLTGKNREPDSKQLETATAIPPTGYVGEKPIPVISSFLTKVSSLWRGKEVEIPPFVLDLQTSSTSLTGDIQKAQVTLVLTRASEKQSDSLFDQSSFQKFREETLSSLTSWISYIEQVKQTIPTPQPFDDTPSQSMVDRYDRISKILRELKQFQSDLSDLSQPIQSADANTLLKLGLTRFLQSASAVLACRLENDIEVLDEIPVSGKETPSGFKEQLTRLDPLNTDPSQVMELGEKIHWEILKRSLLGRADSFRGMRETVGTAEKIHRFSASLVNMKYPFDTSPYEQIASNYEALWNQIESDRQKTNPPLSLTDAQNRFSEFEKNHQPEVEALQKNYEHEASFMKYKVGTMLIVASSGIGTILKGVAGAVSTRLLTGSVLAEGAATGVVDTALLARRTNIALEIGEVANAAGFALGSRALNNLLMDKPPFLDPNKNLLSNFEEIGVEIVDCYLMFKFMHVTMGWAMGRADRMILEKAEEAIAKRYGVAASEVGLKNEVLLAKLKEEGKNLQQVLLDEVGKVRDHWLTQTGLKVGGFGAEYIGLKTWDVAKAIVTGNSEAAKKHLSIEGLEESLFFLLALRFGNEVASPINLKIQKWAHQQTLAPFNAEFKRIDQIVEQANTGLNPENPQTYNPKKSLQSLVEALTLKLNILKALPKEIQDPKELAITEYHLRLYEAVQKRVAIEPFEESPEFKAVSRGDETVAPPPKVSPLQGFFGEVVSKIQSLSGLAEFVQENPALVAGLGILLVDWKQAASDPNTLLAIGAVNVGGFWSNLTRGASIKPNIEANGQPSREVPLLLTMAEGNREGTTLGPWVNSNDSSIAKEHAEIIPLREGGWTIRPLNGNSVLINGAEVRGYRDLKDGDIIQVGQSTFKFNDPKTAKTPLVTSHISLTLEVRKALEEIKNQYSHPSEDLGDENILHAFFKMMGSSVSHYSPERNVSDGKAFEVFLRLLMNVPESSRVSFLENFDSHPDAMRKIFDASIGAQNLIDKASYSLGSVKRELIDRWNQLGSTFLRFVDEAMSKGYVGDYDPILAEIFTTDSLYFLAIHHFSDGNPIGYLRGKNLYNGPQEILKRASDLRTSFPYEANDALAFLLDPQNTPKNETETNNLKWILLGYLEGNLGPSLASAFTELKQRAPFIDTEDAAEIIKIAVRGITYTYRSKNDFLGQTQNPEQIKKQIRYVADSYFKEKLESFYRTLSQNPKGEAVLRIPKSRLIEKIGGAAKITRDENTGHLSLERLTSNQPVFVNGNEVGFNRSQQIGRTFLLQQGDKVRIGNIEFVIDDTTPLTEISQLAGFHTDPETGFLRNEPFSLKGTRNERPRITIDPNNSPAPLQKELSKLRIYGGDNVLISCQPGVRRGNHGELQFFPGANLYEITIYQSTQTKVFVNGVEVPRTNKSMDSVDIKEGDLIKIGDLSFVFRASIKASPSAQLKNFIESLPNHPQEGKVFRMSPGFVRERIDGVALITKESNGLLTIERSGDLPVAVNGITVDSPKGGFVFSANLKQGDRVQVGDHSFIIDHTNRFSDIGSLQKVFFIDNGVALTNRAFEVKGTRNEIAEISIGNTGGNPAISKLGIHGEDFVKLLYYVNRAEGFQIWPSSAARGKVFVNHQEVPSDRATSIKEGDLIQIGDLVFVFREKTRQASGAKTEPPKSTALTITPFLRNHGLPAFAQNFRGAIAEVRKNATNAESEAYAILEALASNPLFYAISTDEKVISPDHIRTYEGLVLMWAKFIASRSYGGIASLLQNPQGRQKIERELKDFTGEKNWDADSTGSSPYQDFSSGTEFVKKLDQLPSKYNVLSKLLEACRFDNQRKQSLYNFFGQKGLTPEELGSAISKFAAQFKITHPDSFFLALEKGAPPTSLETLKAAWSHQADFIIQNRPKAQEAASNPHSPSVNQTLIPRDEKTDTFDNFKSKMERLIQKGKDAAGAGATKEKKPFLVMEALVEEKAFFDLCNKIKTKSYNGLLDLWVKFLRTEKYQNTKPTDASTKIRDPQKQSELLADFGSFVRSLNAGPTQNTSNQGAGPSGSTPVTDPYNKVPKAESSATPPNTAALETQKQFKAEFIKMVRKNHYFQSSERVNALLEDPQLIQTLFSDLLKEGFSMEELIDSTDKFFASRDYTNGEKELNGLKTKPEFVENLHDFIRFLKTGKDSKEKASELKQILLQMQADGKLPKAGWMISFFAKRPVTIMNLFYALTSIHKLNEMNHSDIFKRMVLFCEQNGISKGQFTDRLKNDYEKLKNEIVDFTPARQYRDQAVRTRIEAVERYLKDRSDIPNAVRTIFQDLIDQSTDLFADFISDTQRASGQDLDVKGKQISVPEASNAQILSSLIDFMIYNEPNFHAELKNPHEQKDLIGKLVNAVRGDMRTPRLTMAEKNSLIQNATNALSIPGDSIIPSQTIKSAFRRALISLQTKNTLTAENKEKIEMARDLLLLLTAGEKLEAKDLKAVRDYYLKKIGIDVRYR